MPITIQCPNPACGVTSSVKDSIGGRNVRCKKCGKPFVANPTMDGERSDTRKSHPSSTANLFPTLPAEFGRYRVLRLLGQGGMGAVYLAEDSQLQRQVALKIPFFDAGESPQRVERFIREAQSAAILHHPNICTVFDAGQVDGKLCVMDLAPHKPEEFFTQEVIADGAKITIIVNGKATLNNWEDPNKTFAKGHFALQCHDENSVVTFKKVEYKPIK